jgi:hypothetical protein
MASNISQDLLTIFAGIEHGNLTIPLSPHAGSLAVARPLFHNLVAAAVSIKDCIDILLAELSDSTSALGMTAACRQYFENVRELEKMLCVPWAPPLLLVRVSAGTWEEYLRSRGSEGESNGLDKFERGVLLLAQRFESVLGLAREGLEVERVVGFFWLQSCFEAYWKREIEREYGGDDDDSGQQLDELLRLDDEQ